MNIYNFLPVFLIFSLMSCSKVISEQDKTLLIEARENFEPLPESLIDHGKNYDVIKLGEALYFEKKLSVNDKMVSHNLNCCYEL